MKGGILAIGIEKILGRIKQRFTRAYNEKTRRTGGFESQALRLSQPWLFSYVCR